MCFQGLYDCLKTAFQHLNNQFSEFSASRPFISNYCTSGFIVRLLPIKNDKRWAAFYSHHSDIGGWYTGWTSHIQISALLIIMEVCEGGGDRAWLIWPFICLIDHIGTCGQ